MHGFQPVAHVGQRALHDHAHRIVQERVPHFLFDEARQNSFLWLLGAACSPLKRFPFSGSDPGKAPGTLLLPVRARCVPARTRTVRARGAEG